MKKIYLLSLFLFSAVLLAGKEKNAWNPETQGSTLLIRGNTLYLATAYPGGRIAAFDIANPEKPIQKAEYRSEFFPSSMAVEGTRLYVTDAKNLLVFDIADPATLKLHTKRELASDPFRAPVSVAIRDGNIYTAMRSAGVTVNDVPVRGFYARCVAVGPGGRVFAAGPRFLASLERDIRNTVEIPIRTGTPVRMRMNGSNLYLASGFHGISVYRDMNEIRSVWNGDSTFPVNTGKFRIPANRKKDSDPAWIPVTPVIQEGKTFGGFATEGTFAYDMAFDGTPAGFMYIAAGASGVISADVSQPSGIR